MTRKATTVRLPEELADTAEVVARTRGGSVNQVILDAFQAEVDRVHQEIAEAVAGLDARTLPRAAPVDFLDSALHAPQAGR